MLIFYKIHIHVFPRGECTSITQSFVEQSLFTQSLLNSDLKDLQSFPVQLLLLSFFENMLHITFSHYISLGPHLMDY